MSGNPIPLFKPGEAPPLNPDRALRLLEAVAAGREQLEIMIFNQSDGKVLAHNLPANNRRQRAIQIFLMAEFLRDISHGMMSPHVNSLFIGSEQLTFHLEALSEHEFLAAISPRGRKPGMSVDDWVRRCCRAHGFPRGRS
jgi:hypothetical protein